MKKKRDENEVEKTIDLGDISAQFWEAFGSIFGSKFGVFFGIVFFAILDAARLRKTSTGLRRDFGAGVCAAEPPQGGALFARGGII